MGDHMGRVQATGTGTSLDDRKRRAGQRLLIGLQGPSVSQDLRALVREIRPAGFVLFGRNVVEPSQVRELNRELAALLDPDCPAILAVDQEGGRVQRVRDPATVWPPMRAVGESGSLTAEVSRAMAIELRALGFNLNFAPVADVDSNPDNPVIGDRSFGRDPQAVARHVVDFALAHQDEGVIACAKHFPGHGDTDTDSHLALPVVSCTIERLEQIELVPFRAAVEAGVATVMSSHVVFPALDPDRPATLSPVVIPKLLRQGMGFDGVVFSDDMEMKAVAGRWPLTDQADLGTRAGIDVFLACDAEALQVGLFEALVQVQEQDDGHDRAAIDAVARLDALRECYLDGDRPTPDLTVLQDHSHRILAARARGGGLA